MAKALLVEAGTDDYAFLSDALIYTGPIAIATGITAITLPNPLAGVPYRIEDLLQARVMFTAVAVLNNGAGKRTSRRLYISKLKRTTYKGVITDGGLVGATLGGKVILSVSIPRRASFRL